MIWVAIWSGAIVASACSPHRWSPPLAFPRYHLLVSAALGGVMWNRTGSRRAALAPLASGFLIDVDHVLDYALARTSVRGEKILLLPLHGWEYLPLWALADRLLRTRGGLLLGYALHLAIDQYWNEKRSRLAYFLTYRAVRRFRADQLGPVDPKRRHKWRESSPIGLLRWF